MKRKANAGRKAASLTRFTLVELLVSIAVIALLAALLFPGLRAAKEAAFSAVCLGNQRQCGIGLASYSSDSDMFIPGTYNTHFEPGPGEQHAPWGLNLYRPDYGPVGNEVQTLPGGYLKSRLVFLCPSTKTLSSLKSLKPSDWSYRDMSYSYGMYSMRRDVWKIGDDEWKAFAEAPHCPGETWRFTRISNAPQPASWALLADSSGGGSSLGSAGSGFYARRMTGDETAFWQAHGNFGNVLFGDFHGGRVTRERMGELSNSLHSADGTHGIRIGRTKAGTTCVP